jgi:predicted metalloprotease with PDZ domain
MAEADLRAVLQELAGRPLDAELNAWVHGTAELPLAGLLAAHGITLKAEEAQPAQRLGLRVTEDSAVRIKTVLRGGLAQQAGMAAGDEWFGIEVQDQAWRIAKLDDVLLYAGAEQNITALVARDRRLLRLPLALGAQASVQRRRKAAVPAGDTISLSVTDGKLAGRWLDAH